jgi:hypothetical protein
VVGVLNTRLTYSNPYTGLDRPFGVQKVKAPRTSRQSALVGGKFVSPTLQPARRGEVNRKSVLSENPFPGSNLKADVSSTKLLSV